MLKHIFLVLINLLILLILSGCPQPPDPGPTDDPVPPDNWETEIKWLNGINMPWNDFGKDFGTNYNHDVFEDSFHKYASNYINAVRIWIHCDGSGTLNYDAEGSVSGLKDNSITDFKDMLSLAAEYKLYILPVLWSFDMLKDYGGNGAGLHQEMINNQTKTQKYIDNALIPLINGIKNDPNYEYIFAWEICNEPEWMFEDGDVPLNLQVSKENVQRFHAMIATAIHENTDKPVTTGSASLKWNSSKTEKGCVGNIWSDSELINSHPENNEKAKLDFYQIHFYSWMVEENNDYQPYGNGYTPSFWLLDKPTIIGETPGLDINEVNLSINTIQAYEQAYINEYFGVFGWSDRADQIYGTWENIQTATNTFAYNHPDLFTDHQSPSPTPTPIDPEDIINVPLDYPTIEEALNNAVSGKYVFVDPGTYMISGNIVINEGVTLKLTPDVIIKFQHAGMPGCNGQSYKSCITVNGTLNADNVVFTSSLDDEYGGDTNGDGTATSPNSGDWGYIKINNSSTTITNSTICYGGIGWINRGLDCSTHYNDPYMLWINGCLPVISNNTISDSWKNGIDYFPDPSIDSYPQIDNNTISNCNIGINFDGNNLITIEPSITGNTISNCQTGIYIEGVSSSTLISSNNITDCNSGISMDNVSVAITGNSITNCTYPFRQINSSFPNYSSNIIIGNFWVSVSGIISENGTWSNIQGSAVPYLVTGNLTIDAGTILSIDSGIIVKFQYAGMPGCNGQSYKSCITINGTLIADNVVFTSSLDDEYGGDTNGDDTATSPNSGDWGYIKITDSSTTITNSTIRYGGIGWINRGLDCSTHYNDPYMLWITNSSPSISGSNINYSYQYGIYCENSNPIIQNNNIFGNGQYGLFNTSSEVIDATNNWWGHITGPTHSSNIGGLGDQISSNITYEPWLTNPY